MEFYTLLVNGFVFLLIAVFIRHSLYRLRYHLQMFQQVGYKTHEFRQWFSTHLFSKGVTIEHLLFNVVILVMVYLLADRITLTAGAIVMGIFALFWFAGTSKYREEKEKKPLVYTPRMLRLSIPIVIVLFFLWYLLMDLGYQVLRLRDFAEPFVELEPYFMSFGMVLVDILIPAFVWIFGWILKPVELYIQNGFKKQARKKIASLPHLKVIAITGSYGKTSTKFVIDAFLKERMSVCTTPGSYNTPMGICKVINNRLEANHKALILEMGARYEGNIKELCDLAQPDISVITNVGIAHLETFGSQEIIAYEKATLARELKENGTLILNGEDPLVREMADLRDDVKTVFVGRDGSIRASNIQTGSEGTSFLMEWFDENGKQVDSETIKTRLLGRHNIQNFLIGAAVAREFDIRLKTIALAASRMEPVEHRLELKHRDGFVIIDDAFNSNPVGAENAVKVLSSFQQGRKFIITPGMIELGDKEEEKNEEFGRQIGESEIDVAILVGEDRTKPILRGIQATDKGEEKEVRVVNSLFEANDLLKSEGQKGDVVLYENDLPDTYNS
ncbi:MAG: Mur ligase family protein [Balneolaceae bacterium]|nr:Mur ligase family protein [Balneolaceae bacterium]